MKRLIMLIITIMIFSSAYSQKVPSVVATVDLNRYKGTWYEIARLPIYFEKKLKCVTATYTLRDDGKNTVFILQTIQTSLLQLMHQPVVLKSEPRSIPSHYHASSESGGRNASVADQDHGQG